MQEVWGSNPHSSTQVKTIKSNSCSQSSEVLYSSKVQQRTSRTPVLVIRSHRNFGRVRRYAVLAFLSRSAPEPGHNR
jgi:hypothetical protein